MNRNSYLVLTCLILAILSGCSGNRKHTFTESDREFNGDYTGTFLNRIAFPLGGLGAGMICLDGNGAFSAVSVRNKPDAFNTPFMFAALSVKGYKNAARILEGPVQSWKLYGSPGTANGSDLFGCPRHETAIFSARFPFGTVHLSDPDMPVETEITGWSPFIPGDSYNSSLPVAGVEYTITNTTKKPIEAMFSFSSENFMRIENPSEWGGIYVGKDSIMQMEKGFILEQQCFPDKPHYKGEFAIFTDEPEAIVDYCWFRGGWFDSKTVLWNNIASGIAASNPVSQGATGASLFVPVNLKPGESKTIRVMMAWHVPHSDLRIGTGPDDAVTNKLIEQAKCTPGSGCCPTGVTTAFYEPWYSGQFTNVEALAGYWRIGYSQLRASSSLFSDAFFSSDLPAEVLEAISANLSILKSPTVLRQKDGRLWSWEGCHDQSGCCNGSCTHVWNYAQAIPHLFPDLERTLRETEFLVDQSREGHQNFRANLPIRATNHDWYAAADGQLGGIMKIYRDWRICGDTAWLERIWPAVRTSMDYCISHWDPRHTGTIEEPHHNTYDIEFWGPDALCTGFYLGALKAAIQLSAVMGQDTLLYKELLDKGLQKMENDLYNGEYFIQHVTWEGLNAGNPIELGKKSIGTTYSSEALEILKSEGPKYQYGSGCLSDGVLGLWMAEVCGLGSIVDDAKVRNHLLSVHRYNLKTDLSDHVNPQRAGYAYGKEGGLLLCTWPKGGQPTLPFVYSNEVWTGIEYQVASHLMLAGHVAEGLDIVRTCRKRYDGRVRNPFDEYECGHWYARAMSSYGMLQGLTGLRYDAASKTLYIDSRIGIDFKCFLSTGTGFGMAGLRRGRPFLEVKYGKIEVQHFIVSGKEMS